MSNHSICISFDDNSLLGPLFGYQNEHLEVVEKALGLAISTRGSMVAISGAIADVKKAESVLRALYGKLEDGYDVGLGEVEAAIRLIDGSKEKTKMPKEKQKGKKSMPKSTKQETASPDLRKVLDRSAIQTPKKRLTPYTHKQATYMEALMTKELVFAAGPAGTGKTYVAVAAAVAMFAERRVERIILSRPAVEAGEKLGFLPGDLKDKVDPYLRPMYDALYDMMPAEKVAKCIATGEIEIAPLAYMRGRTLRNAYIILDEAQNTSAVQMKMFLTRLGEGSRMVVTGDLTQTDLPSNMKSGFRDALEKLIDIDEVEVINFTSKEVIRHPLVTKVVAAYEKHDKEKLDKWEKK